jgi:hypothetical protein
MWERLFFLFRNSLMVREYASKDENWDEEI